MIPEKHSKRLTKATQPDLSRSERAIATRSRHHSRRNKKTGNVLRFLGYCVVCIIMTSQSLKEYRCTRNSLYSHECLGRDDVTARQGHYIRAESEQEALTLMEQKFPDDTEGFTAKLWKEQLPVWANKSVV